MAAGLSPSRPATVGSHGKSQASDIAARASLFWGDKSPARSLRLLKIR